MVEQAHSCEEPGKTPIVAIGASAGGLEPLEQFFAAAPIDAGWSFVVIQHLSPDYESMMDSLLSRQSSLRIRHIEEGMKPEPDTIYLNRPNRLSMLIDETFHVEPYQDGDKLPRLPIDSFFYSIADRDPLCTAAVILSGSGSDGTRGARTLHDHGATVLVQSPAEATFISMPKSAIVAEAATMVLMAAEMPDILSKAFAGEELTPQKLNGNADAPRNILTLLEGAHELDFSDYKPENVLRRIERRQYLRGYHTIEEYEAELAENPAMLEELYHDLLIGVTEFYRDNDSIRSLRTNAINKLLTDGDQSQPLRIWVPACASGEEAYTIAIECNEAITAAGSSRKFRVIATDVHRRSVDQASTGIFSASSLSRVPEALREKYFVPNRDQFMIDSGLRQKIIFSVHNVLSDPPFMNLDLISCRNLLIYLNDIPQSRLISMFLFGLRKEGYLLLGPSETLGRFASEFKVIDSRWRLFRKASNKRLVDTSLMTSKVSARPNLDDSIREKLPQRLTKSAPVTDLRGRDALIKSYDALLKRFVPPSILITENAGVLSWFGAASAFVDTLNNLAEWTVEDIVHSDLHFSINVAIERLREGHLEQFTRQIKVDINGQDRPCEVTIEPIGSVTGTRLMLVIFALDETGGDEPEPRNLPSVEPTSSSEDEALLSRRILELERDLRLTEETLQHVTERLEASGEELQASNEELQASNEELQASNEELQSSNEELHAVNEELVSLSAEHERQIEVLSELNRNTELVLSVLDVGVIFVDTDCRILRFSDIVADTFELEQHDVSRSLGVVGPRLSFVDLQDLARQVLDTGDGRVATGEHDGRPLTVTARAFVDETGGTGEGSGVVVMLQWGERPD